MLVGNPAVSIPAGSSSRSIRLPSMHAVIFLVSSDDPANIEYSVKKWNDILSRIINHNFLKFLIINKKDEDPIDNSNFINILSQNNISKLFVVDAKISKQVNEAFDEIFDDVLEIVN